MRLTGKNCGKILCDECGQPLTSVPASRYGMIACPICGTLYEGAVFNVAGRFRQRASAPVNALQLQDAQCFFHPGKEACAVCVCCGRMLCALCDIEQSAGHTCPRCLNDGGRDGINSERRSSLAYTQIAWGLMAVSFFFLFIPALAAAGFAVAGLRNRDYCYTAGRRISLAAVVLLVMLLLILIPVLIFEGMRG